MLFSDFLYRKAVTSHSPGLPRFAATLGSMCKKDLYPNRGCGSLVFVPSTIGNTIHETSRTPLVLIEPHTECDRLHSRQYG